MKDVNWIETNDILEGDDFGAAHRFNNEWFMPKFHMHPHYEFYLFLSGNVQILIEDDSFDARPMDLFIFPPGIQHRAHLVNTHKNYERAYFYVTRQALLNFCTDQIRLLDILENAVLKKEYCYHIGEENGNEFLRMIDALCRENGRKSEDLKTVFLAGNTTMQHLFARISPESIAAAPFEPQSYFDSPVPFSLSGKEIMLTPCVSGYMGGDIVSGMYALGLDKAEGKHLFLDVGTNGEMALGGKDGFLTCAVACGPAFEGAGISCGMPASAGAISRVWCEGDSLCYEVIGGGEATGLCGSGLLDLAACLTELGYISPDGRLFGDEDENGRAVFPLTEHVVLTAGDVRQLQLAKAAVAAGIRILLEDSGVSYDEIDTLYLAGGFGTRLNPKSAAALGMLPEELLGKVRSAGNASLLGMETALLSGGERRLLAVRNMCDYTELSTHSRFSETFVEEMLFPSDGEWDD